MLMAVLVRSFLLDMKQPLIRSASVLWNFANTQRYSRSFVAKFTLPSGLFAILAVPSSHPPISTRCLISLLLSRFDLYFAREHIWDTDIMTQETLRYHAVVYNVLRVSSQDDILPLSEPIITTCGKVLHELPIPKGLQIISSVAAYNRLVLVIL